MALGIATKTSSVDAMNAELPMQKDFETYVQKKESS